MSAYSFLAMAKYARPMMKDRGEITYVDSGHNTVGMTDCVVAEDS
ncbi:hypothetical protein [Leucothrix arctica]|nr:hypothetical protein [Leucothrix arctica]